MMEQKPRINLIGKRFESLVIKSRAGHKKNKAMWLCQCDCGNTTISSGHDLRRNHKKSCGCKFFMRKDDTTCRSLYGTYKSLAQKRGHEFSINYDVFNLLTQQSCFYCNKKPNKIIKSRKDWYPEFIYNGIDRYDNTKGYIPGNVVSCCGICNRFKSNYTVDIFLNHCQDIINYQNFKKQAEMACSSITSNN